MNTVNDILAGLINKLQVAQVLRQDSMGKLAGAFDKLGVAQQQEAEAVEGQKLATAEIAAAKADLDTALAREQELAAQLAALQTMLQPVPEPTSEPAPDPEPVEAPATAEDTTEEVI
jgi:hypothetical protein